MKFGFNLVILGLLLVVPIMGQEKSPDPAPPSITKVELEQRLLELKQGLEQAKANVHAYDGAISDVQYWLDKLAKKDMVKEAPKNIPDMPIPSK